MLNQETIATIRRQSKQLVIDIMCRSIDQKQAEDTLVDICLNAIYDSNTEPKWSPSTEALAIRAHQKMMAVKTIAPVPNTETSLKELIIPDIARQTSMANIEKAAILNTLKKHNWNRRKAATELGISERTLYRKTSRYKIEQ